MLDSRALELLKASLIEAWDHGSTTTDTSSESGATFEGLSIKRPRGGFAVGHSFDERTGSPRLELRVTAASGPNHAHARQLEENAKAQGIETNLKVYPRPVVALAGSAAGATVAPVIGGRRRPLHLGASVAHEGGAAGGLGAFVHLEGGSPGIVPWGHVLPGANWIRLNVGDPIQQPGAPDPVPISNRIGALTDQFAPFIPALVKNLDAAIGRLSEGTKHLGNTVPALECVPRELRGKPIGTPVPADELKEGTRVFKVGRTTCYTEARVSALSFQNLRVQFGSDPSQHVFTFSGVHEVLWDSEGSEYSEFTAPGDSGALVMTRDDLCPVGLHFCAVAGTDGSRVSYVIPWFRIVDTFGVTLSRMD